MNSRNRHLLPEWRAGIVWCLVLCTGVQADPFHLDSLRNQALLRLEMNNDLFFEDDSRFSNGFSLQYHGVRYATWEESRAPGFVIRLIFSATSDLVREESLPDPGLGHKKTDASGSFGSIVLEFPI